MKKLVVFLILCLPIILFAQQSNDTPIFSQFKFGVYGGLTVGSSHDFGGEFFLEEKTNLSENFNLNFGASYFTTFKSDFYTIKSYRSFELNGQQYNITNEYNIIKESLNFVTFSVGSQYKIFTELPSPYILFGLNYNVLIDFKTFRTPGYSRGFDSVEDIPDEFKQGSSFKPFPGNSRGFTLGTGMLYGLSKNIELDFRYFFRYDDKIINTHHIIVGVLF